MVRFLSVLLLAAPTAVQAMPWLYVSSFTYSGSGYSCMREAETALRRAGFTRDLERDPFDDPSTGGHVDGKLRHSDVAAAIECDADIGTSALAVSGLDNDLTYDKYSDLFDYFLD